MSQALPQVLSQVLPLVLSQVLFQILPLFLCQVEMCQKKARFAQCVNRGRTLSVEIAAAMNKG